MFTMLLSNGCRDYIQQFVPDENEILCLMFQYLHLTDTSYATDRETS